VPSGSSKIQKEPVTTGTDGGMITDKKGVPLIEVAGIKPDGVEFS